MTNALNGFVSEYLIPARGLKHSIKQSRISALISFRISNPRKGTETPYTNSLGLICQVSEYLIPARGLKLPILTLLV